jgi:CRP-like cAMP-binding protein
MYLHADLTKTLRRIPWFVDLSQNQLECLSSIATLHELDAGDVLFQEGDREDFLYILLEGQVLLEVEVPTRGKVQMYTAEVLDILGWSSMTPVMRQRTATAQAERRCLLLGFNSKFLQQLCEEDHDLGYIIMRRLANVVANRMMTTRLCLLDMIAQSVPEKTHAVR